MDRVHRGVTPRRHYVPHFNGCTHGHAGFGWRDGSEDSSNHSRRQFCDDGQRIGASTADALAQWFGTCTADAMEERIGASTADTVEKRFGSGSADTLEVTSAA
jgi:hypothetical protein